MNIDLRASSYPSLLEAVGLAVVNCDGMERAIPSVFRAALGVSREFQREIFEAARGLGPQLKITEAAIREGAPEYLDRWQEIASRVRSYAGKRGKIAHAGMSIYGGGIFVEIDDDGVPTGVSRSGTPVASLAKFNRDATEYIEEHEIRELADHVLAVTRDLDRLAGSIAVSRPNFGK